jgi:hypothetical protein
MSTIYPLSTYSLATISNQVVASSSTPIIIWSASIPAGAKGRNAILQLFFNLFCASNFAAGQNFFYGLYVDGVPLAIGDSTTMKYVHTAANQYAISAAGVGLGTNPLFGYQPLVIPLAISPTASQIQIGITNSSLGMATTTSTTLAYTTASTSTSGSLNTSNYIPQTAFTTPIGSSFTYTVPTTCSMGAVQGVYIYLWGTGGFGSAANPGGAGGHTSGFYSCAGGTQLTCLIGSVAGNSLATGGGGSGYTGNGGGFTAVFNSASLTTSSVIGVAGGGGGQFIGWANGSGGAGGGLVGSTSYNYNLASVNSGCTGGTQTSGGSNADGYYTQTTGGNSRMYAGQQWIGGGAANGNGDGGGGWFGGGSGGSRSANTSNGGCGGSGYIGGFTSGGVTVNGTTATAPNVAASNILPGGATVMSNFGFDPRLYGTGVGSTGLIIIIPAIGTTAVQVGVSASLYAL